MGGTRMRLGTSVILGLVIPVALATGCSKAPTLAASPGPAPAHHHHPPHGGTPVVLGDEDYHVELVLDESTGKLQAFVLDGEMENFVRSSSPTIVVTATVDGTPRDVALAAVPNPETGETVGDTSLFEGQADWLKTTPRFDAVLKGVVVRGTAYGDVKFNFPKGNDKGS